MPDPDELVALRAAAKPSPLVVDEGMVCPECHDGRYVCVHGPAVECDAGYPHGSHLCASCAVDGGPEVHDFTPQPGCNVCVCGAVRDDPHHLQQAAPAPEAHNIVSWVEASTRGWFQCSCGAWFVTEGYDSKDKSMGAIITKHQAASAPTSVPTPYEGDKP